DQVGFIEEANVGDDNASIAAVHSGGDGLCCAINPVHRVLRTAILRSPPTHYFARRSGGGDRDAMAAHSANEVAVAAAVDRPRFGLMFFSRDSKQGQVDAKRGHDLGAERKSVV